MSMDNILSNASIRHTYRCYNCNVAFHITTTSGASFFFRCPRCFYHHLLQNYTIVNITPPFQSFIVNFTPPTISTSNFDSSDYETDFDETDSDETDSDESDSDETDSDETDSDETDFDNLSFELFDSTQLSSPTLKSFLNSLPSVKIDESSKNCSICLEEFEIDTEASQFPCKHFFHNECIVPWLIKNNTCPLCRHKLPQEDEDEIEKDVQVIPDGEIGDREFQDNNIDA